MLVDLSLTNAIWLPTAERPGWVDGAFKLSSCSTASVCLNHRPSMVLPTADSLRSIPKADIRETRTDDGPRVVGHVRSRKDRVRCWSLSQSAVRARTACGERIEEWELRIAIRKSISIDVNRFLGHLHSRIYFSELSSTLKRQLELPISPVSVFRLSLRRL